MKNKFTKFLLLATCLFSSFHTSAGTEPLNVRLSSANIFAGNGIAISDNKFTYPGPDAELAGWAKVNSSVGQLVLGIDQSVLTNPYTSFTLKVNLSVKAYDKLGAIIPVPSVVSLEVKYSKNFGFQFKDRDVFVVKNCHKITGIITSIIYTDANNNIITNPTSVPSIVFMEADMLTDRVYQASAFGVQNQLQSSDISIIPVALSSAYELEINWPHQPAAEEYDLEYTFVNNYDETTPIAASALVYDFRNNSTRITTTQNFHRLSLVFEKGYLLFRVRARGRDLTNPSAVIYGDWSNSCSSGPCEFGIVSNYINFYQVVTPHDDAKNWQYTANFAEDGKKKEVVTYFDGSLRNRQSVTKVNTLDNVVVAENLYDYQGRPAVNVLPVPINFPNLNYRDKFNQQAAGVAYNKDHFDKDASVSGCVMPNAPPMVNSSGAANYYSNSNADQNEQQAYVPDANGFPFTQIEYTPDNTGRIRRQGGVGDAHQLNSGHETKYYFGQPEQDELDMLFGSEAGYYNHYKKNMVVDANGQISNTYIDMYGRTVATSLAGTAPNNTTPIPAVPKQINSVYIEPNATSPNPNIKVGENAILFTKELVVSTPGNYIFDYSLQEEHLEAICSNNSPQMCYSCVYDLSIDILDECGASLLGTPFSHPIGSISSDPFTCPTSKPMFPQTAGILPLTVPITKVGSYTVIKKLTANESVANSYVDDYLSKDLCIKTLSDFDNEASLEIDLSGCHQGCPDCWAYLGSASDHNDLAKATVGDPSYDPDYVYMTPTEYAERVAECEQICKTVTECDVLYQLMLGDVSPSGQYAQYTTLSTGALDASQFALSLLNTNNVLPQSFENSITGYSGCTPVNGAHPANWKNPHDISINTSVVNGYRDKDGSRSRIYLTQTGASTFFPDYDHVLLPGGPTLDGVTNTYYVYPEQLNDLKDFVNAFGQNPQWAHSLIEYHPEWGYYGLCTQLTDPTYATKLTKTSDQFDEELRSLETYVDAVNAGYIASGALDLYSKDPFFDNTLNGNTPLGESIPGAKDNFLYNIVNDYKNSGKTLKETATQIIRCNNVYYGSTNACEGTGFGDASYFATTDPQELTAIQDAEWRMYRDLYLGEKQKLSKNIINKLAKGSFNNSTYKPNDDGFFNGPIGIGNEYYNPFANDMIVLGSYWSFWWWTFTPPFSIPASFPSLFNQIANPRCDGYGAFDPAQPSHYAVWPYYTNKTKRFVTADEALPPGVSVNTINSGNITALTTYGEFNIFQATGQCPVTMNFQGFLNQLVEDFKLTTTTPYPLVLNSYFTKEMYDVIDYNSGTFSLYKYLPNSNFATSNVLNGEFYDAGNSLVSCGFSLISTSNSSAFPWMNLKYFTDIQFISESPTGTYNFTIKGYYDHDLNPYTANVEETFRGSTCFKLGGCSLANFCSPTQTASELLALINVLHTSNSDLTSTTAIDLSVSPYTAVITPKLKKPFGGSSSLFWAATGAISGNHLIANLYRTSPSSISGSFDFDFSQITGGYANIKFFSSISPHASNPNIFVLQAYVGLVNNEPKFIPVEVLITPPGATPLYNIGNCGAPPNLNCQLPQNQTLKDMGQLMNDLATPQSATWPPNKLVSSTSPITPVDLTPMDGFTTLLQSYLTPNNSKTYNYSHNAYTTNGNYTVYASIGTGASACNIEMTSYKLNKIYNYSVSCIMSFTDIKADNSQLATGGYPSNFNIIAHFYQGDTSLIHVKTSCFQFKNCVECDVAQPLFVSETFDAYTPGIAPSTAISPDYTYESGTNCNLNTLGYTILNSTYQPNVCVFTPGTTHMQDANDHSSFDKKNFLRFHVDPLTISTTKGLWRFTNGSTNLVTVAPNTNYEFSCWYRKSNAEPALVTLSANNTIISQEVIPSITTNLGVWKQLKGYWNSGTSTTADIRVNISNSSLSDIDNTNYVDLDEIIFRTKPCMPIHAANPQPTDSVETWEPCDTMLTAIGNANALVEYERYIASEKANFKKSYLSKCLSAFESFGVQYTDQQHHYTLYYYDQAGNLIKTVPPAGVELIPLTSTFPNSSLTYKKEIANDRLNNTRNVTTKHRMATTYEYNSLNQIINQSLPDHDKDNLWTLTTTVNNSQPTLPTGVVVNSMDFNGQHGFLVGTDGTSNSMNGVIYSTNDGGVNWVPASSVGYSNLNKVQDAGSSIIYAIGDGGTLLKSTNDGANWSLLSVASSVSKINDLHFFTTLSGIVVGDNGSIYKTTNGGTSWTQQTGVVSTGVNLNDIQFTDSQNGYIAGTNGTLLYTINGGANWSSPSIPLNSNLNITSIHFYDPQIISTQAVVNGFITGYDVSTNQGKTIYVTNLRSVIYNTVPNPLNTVNYSGVIFNNGVTPAKPFNSIAIADPSSTSANYADDEILTAGKNGEIYKISYNANTTLWDGIIQAVPTNYTGEISQLSFTRYNGTTVPLATAKDANILKFNGTNWAPLSGFTNSTPLNGIYFSQPYSSGSNVYAVGNGGQIYKSTDGASSFVNVTQASFPKLNDVSIAKDNSGLVVAVGDGGAVIRSTDNGLNWVSITPITSYDFNTVWAFDNTNAFIAGSSGKGTKLSNGALSSISTFGSNTINDVHFLSPTLGYFVGNGGVLYKSTDAGINWSSLSSGTSNDLKSIHSYGNTVLAVGNSGTILRSVNGGGFSSISQSALAPLECVRLVDNTRAYAFGPNSLILKTQDGGLTWMIQVNYMSGNIFKTAFFTDQGTALIGVLGNVNLSQFTDNPGNFTSSFWYDRLGRLIISQNVKQLKNAYMAAFSYTKYDNLGRVIEVGQILNNIKPSGLSNENGVISDLNYLNWLSAGLNKSDVTTTKYDQQFTNIIAQKNMRNRVSATYIDNNSNLSDGFQAANFYSYDVHGNVSSALEDIPALLGIGTGQRYKKIDYNYDLISGKVNEVKYQDKQPDAFYQKYYYDADNRITNVYTSRNSLYWEQDAKYFYYKHGPLARVEIGDEKVQGTDYAYTLHGWIKGVNSSSMKQLRDIGKDGELTLTATGPLVYNNVQPTLNKFISQDAFGYSLNFYNSDYKAIVGNASGAKYGPLYRFDADISTTSFASQGRQMYNGNISAMATAIPSYNGAVTLTGNPVLMTYEYDQLNRLSVANSYYGVSTVATNNYWPSTATNNWWKNAFTYDANGNILTQNRYNQIGAQIDQMVYRYDLDGNGNPRKNRLYHVNDNIAFNGTSADDIDDQGTFTPGSTGTNVNTVNNYKYDEIGNLFADMKEEIGPITWSVYGKIKTILHYIGTKPDFEFIYNSNGQRVTKIVKPRVNGMPAQNTALHIYTYYRRDPQGNVMAIYEVDKAASTYKIKEFPMYGSSRLGGLALEENYSNQVNINASQYKLAHYKGDKNYELSNHLGNVITVVSDRRKAIDDDYNTITDRFEAEVLSFTDYYPFGQPMPYRQFNNGSYRYGFNGKENDNEVKGTGNQQDYGMRIYDNRLGKFLSVDPLTRSYPMLTPYQFASNRPIDGIDRDGEEYEAVFGAAFSSSGYDPNAKNQEGVAQDFTDDFKEQLKKPETYKGAIVGLGPYVVTGMVMIMTGGAGAGLIAEADATAFIPTKSFSKPPVLSNLTAVELNNAVKITVEQAAKDQAILRSLAPWKNEGVNTVAVAGNNSQYYAGTNGPGLQPAAVSVELKPPLKPQGTNWGVLNCAEPKAINQSLVSGVKKADISVSNAYGIRKYNTMNYMQGDLELTTYSNGAVFPKAPCPNCVITKKGTSTNP